MEEKLLEFVKVNEMMYDKGFKSYKYKSLKEKKWAEFAQEQNTTVDVVKKRWKTLRDRYYRENKRTHLASGRTAKLVKTWKYYELMEFLGDCKPQTKITSKYPKDMEESHCWMDELDVASTLKKDKKIMEVCDNMSKLLESAKETFAKKPTSIHMYFSSIAEEVDQVVGYSFEDMRELKNTITNAVCHFQMETSKRLNAEI